MIKRSIFSYGFVKIVLIIAAVTGVLYATRFGVGFIEGFLSSASGSYHNLIFGYQFDVPKHWEITTKSNDEKIVLISPSDNESEEFFERIYVEVAYVMAGRDESGAAKDCFNKVKLQCTGRIGKHKSGSATVGGVYAKHYLFSCVKGGVWVAIESFFIFKGGRIYMVTYVVNDKEYDRRHSVFGDVIGSFKLN